MGQSVESAVIALAAIFFLAHSAYLNNFRQKILYFDAVRQKSVLFCNKIMFRYAKNFVTSLPNASLCGYLWFSPCLSLALYGSLWLSVTPTLAPSGSLWLLLTLSGFHWLSLALTGSLPVSLWLSVTPTLALTGSHCHSLAYSGPLWLTIAL